MRRSALAGAFFVSMMALAVSLLTNNGPLWRRIVLGITAGLAGGVVFLVVARWELAVADVPGRPETPQVGED